MWARAMSGQADSPLEPQVCNPVGARVHSPEAYFDGGYFLLSRENRT